MRTYVSCLALLCALAVDSCSNAYAANSRVTVKRDDDKTITVYTRALPPVDRYQRIHTLREPAPANACDTATSSAFQIVNRDDARCVGKVNKQ